MTNIREIFEDQHLLVLDKPAGLLSQGDDSGDENLVDILRVKFGRHYVGLVHRLDRNTSGLMVVAKRSKAAERLTSALQSGQLQRGYLGWLFGEVKSQEIWTHSLLKDNDNLVTIVRSGTPQSKIASLSCKPQRVAVYEGEVLTLCEFELDTGRSHQIRVQSEAQGHPLLGDHKYFKGLSDRQKKLSLRSPRPALHSNRLAFPHPMSKELLEFKSELPKELQF